MERYNKLKLKTMKDSELFKLQGDWMTILRKFQKYEYKEYDDYLDDQRKKLDEISETGNVAATRECYIDYLRILQNKTVETIQNYLNSISVDEFAQLLK